MSAIVNQKEIEKALEGVQDPELPCINIVDLGMLHRVDIKEQSIYVELLPTFSGCPALDFIKQDVVNIVEREIESLAGVRSVDVSFIFDPPWTTDRISPQGRENLKSFGVSPPPAHYVEGEPWKIDCPYCGSAYTTMDNIFGPTACRSVLYCHACHNPFESMKPVANM